MSKLLFNMAMISTKALISAYTWTTLPFYAMAQRPWTKVELHKLLSKQVHVKLDKQGRLIYSRPSEKNSRSLYQCRTFPEALLSLDHNRKKIGIRDVISEKTALDSNGTPIIVDGRPLKKLQLKNHFRWLTIGQVFDRVDSIARGLNSMGIKKGDKVLIYAENSPEWFFTSLALIKLNAITVTLFSTLGDQGVVYGINESDSDFMFTSQQLLPKLLQLYPQINSLKKIVYFANGRETFTLDECSPSVEIMTLDQLEECGQKIPMLKYDLPKSNDTALIMFTSGTTGNPKGVVITHGQLNASVHNILRMDEDFENTGANSYHACYLPMAHIFGYIVNLTIFLTNSRIAFCSPFTLFDSSPVHVPGQVGDLKLIQPEYFSTVPLILERILKEIYQNLNKRSRLAAPLFNYMMDYKIHWMKNGYQTPIINRLVCKKINKQFGGRLKMIGVGSAPLNERTHALIKAALNVKINYAYGATENCGPAAVTQLNDLGYGSCGFPYHSFKYYLKDWPEGGYTTRDLPNARGEIVLGGETIANEYFNMPEESKESFTVDPDGTRWYHTGDIGEIQPNLMLKIIDRKKDFIKLANGEFVSLGKIEAGLRTCLLVDNICICTNPYCNHVTALIIPNHQALKALAQTYGREQNTVEQLCNDPLIVSSVLKSVKSHGNELGFKSKELPVQITLIPDEWTPNNNLLTAAFKVKRKEVYNQYREKIDAMFALWLFIRPNILGTFGRVTIKMSKLLIQLFMLQTKTMVNAYTWTTLPLYTIIQRPWQRLNRSKSFNVKSYVDKQGRTIYYRPTPADITHKYLKYTTFAEIVNTLDRNREVVGQRDVIKEHVALDENGKPVKIDGKVLKKVELSKEFRWKTVGEVLDHVDSLAKGLLQLGVKRGDKVLIYAENGIEWFYTCLALVRINAVTVTLFSTLGDSGLVYGINQCDAQYVITSQSLLKNLDKLSKQFNQLRTIVYIEDQKCDCNQVVNSLIEKKFQVKSYREIEENGSKLPPIEYSNPNPDETLLIMYTSGTTGNPKGVIITHGQFVQSLHNLLRKDLENDSMAFESTFAAYLPMAHLFGYMMNIGMFVSDSKIAFCSPFTLLDSSPAHVPGQVGDIKLIEPEFLVGVPIVLERILKEIYRKLNAQSPIAEPLFTYLMDYKIRWTARGYQTPIINKLVCKKINDQFGGKLRIMAVSSAPLHERTHSLMEAALNVRIVEVYGSTEMTGGSHVVSMHDLSYGNVGVPYHSFKYYLKDWTEGGYSVNDKPNPRGEIVTSSNTIANGYYKLPEETEEAFTKDEDGTKWYHSGDIGEVLPNGTLKVIDRKKDLNKLANGEFVSLGKIESGLRNSIYVENMCICTDRYSNHVVAIISPNRLALSELASRLSKSHLSHEEMCNDPDINDHVLKSIKRFSKELGFKIREIPVAIKLVPEEWSQENNLLTAAFKMKRKQVNDYYKGQIEAMFSNE